MTQAHVSRTTYLGVFAALMVLLVLTVWIAHVDLGRGNLLAALSIASVKAMLIVLFFMHVRWASGRVVVWAVAALLWLVILLAVLDDYVTR